MVQYIRMCVFDVFFNIAYYIQDSCRPLNSLKSAGV